ncbi:MAG: CoA transferase [Dehalococcoidia bacterium]|nr:CoA transferase [Dehalococcoidia bacterium]
MTTRSAGTRNGGAVRGALTNMRVLDLTHAMAGPYCTKLLADYGADVVKVERPGTGDMARWFGPFPDDRPDPERGGLFLYLNTNKKSVTLDLKSAEGRALALRLAAKADVVVESFAPGVMASFGLSPDALRAANPAVVLVSVSNFGQTGPYRDYRATELVLEAMGGLVAVNGAPDRAPLKLGLAQGPYLAGSVAAAGALGAFYARRGRGAGQHVDIAISECITTVIRTQVVDYTYMGVVGWRRPGQVLPLHNIMPCKDGYVVPQVGNNRDWEHFVAFTGIEAFQDPRYASAEGRHRWTEEIERHVQKWLVEQGKKELFHQAQEWRLPFGIVQDAGDLLRCEQLEARGFFTVQDHPVAGAVRLPGPPFRLSASPWRKGRAPLLGEHTEEVLCGHLGLDPGDVAALREKRVA